jgi:transcriptional regulator with XRE-family HTH domain
MTVAIQIRNYTELTQALAARRRQLGLRQLDLDEKAGLQNGYAGKVEAGIRHLGYLSLPMILAALDADLFLAPRGSTAPVEARQGSAGAVQHLDRSNQP